MTNHIAVSRELLEEILLGLSPNQHGLRLAVEDLLDGPGVEPVAWVRFCSDGCYEGPIMHAAMEDVRKNSGAWTPLYLAAPSAPVPDGWQLVPKAITLEMQHAYFKVIDKNMQRVQTDCTFGRYSSNAEAYRAMLAAAPQPPKENGE